MAGQSKGSTIVIGDDDEGGAPVVRPAKGMPKDWVCIQLEEDERIAPTGQTVSLNGDAFRIRPGEKCWVPPGVIEVLDNAVESVPVKNAAQQVIGHRNKRRFAYRIVQPDVATA